MLAGACPMNGGSSGGPMFAEFSDGSYGIIGVNNRGSGTRVTDPFGSGGGFARRRASVASAPHREHDGSEAEGAGDESDQPADDRNQRQNAQNPQSGQET